MYCVIVPVIVPVVAVSAGAITFLVLPINEILLFDIVLYQSSFYLINILFINLRLKC